MDGHLRPIHRPVFLQRDARVMRARKKSAERPLQQPRSLEFPAATTLARWYVTSHCSSPAPAPNRVTSFTAVHRAHLPPHGIQFCKPRAQPCAITQRSQPSGSIGCARADACITDDRTPLAASVIACAARLLQNRCIETHQNKSTPRGGASERSNNRASAPRGGAAAFRTTQ